MPIRLKSRMIADAKEREMQNQAEVERDDEADENFQDQDEFALRHQIGFTGLVDQLRHFEHRPVHRQFLQARIRHEPEQQTEHADAEARHEQRSRVDAEKAHLAEIGQYEARLTAPGVNRRFRRLLPHRRFGRRRQDDEQR